jgi:hypothetical protein
MRLARAAHAALVAALAWLVPAAFVACSDGANVESQPDAANDATYVDASLPDQAADVVATPVDAGACSKGGFCREPLPVHQPLVGVTASSADDAWTVGGDVVLRWDGTSWKTVYQYRGTLPSFAFVGVWGTKSDDIWALAAADSRAFLVRGASVDGGAPALHEVVVEDELTPWDDYHGWLAPSADELWLLKRYGRQLRRMRELPDRSVVVDDVMPPTTADDPAISFEWESIWGFAPNDVYVGGYECPDTLCNDQRGALAHYDGAAWSITVLDTTESVSAIVGTTDADQPHQLWLGRGRAVELVPVTSDGSVGASLYTQTIMTEVYDCSHLIGAAVSPALAWLSNGCVVYRWNGAGLDVMPVSANGIPSAYVKGMWAGKAGEAWIVGESLNHGPDAPKTGFTARREGDAP